MSREILQTLKEAHEGELVGLIEENRGKHTAWISVFQGLTEESTREYKKSDFQLVVYERERNSVILSKNLFILNPTTRVIGRVGFHIPNIFEVNHSTPSKCTPKEIYLGEYEIKQALKQIPELALYTKLIDSYPIHDNS